MSDKTENMKLWNAVEPTHPKYVKPFKKGGGFSGTAINPVYLIKAATEQWGPMGDKWGVRVLNEDYAIGAPLFDKKGEPIPGAYETIHVVRIELWHPGGDGGVVESYGQTTFVGMNKYGPYTDEEAPKKSLTDATTKALSLLGFSADIFLGMWDDSKYVNDRKQAVRAEAKKPVQATDDNMTPPEETLEKAVQKIDKAVEEKSAELDQKIDEAVDKRWTTWEKNMETMVEGLKSDEDLMTLKENVRPEFESCPDREIRKRVAMLFANKGAEFAEKADA